MEQKVLILRYGELALKGKNRVKFEAKLADNVKSCLARNGIRADIEKVRGRLFVRTGDESAAGKIRDVFGLVSISPAVEVDADISVIKEEALRQLNDAGGKTFRVTTNRPNKAFHMTSIETDRDVGAFLVEKTGKGVKLNDAEVIVGIEIQKKAYVFTKTIDCFGGLPLGMSGNMLAFIDSEESVLAAWLMMRRGCVVFPVVLGDQDISLLERFSYGNRIDFVEKKDAAQFAADRDILAVVSGQGFEDIAEIDNGLAVIRPLIGFDDEMISDLKKRLR